MSQLAGVNSSNSSSSSIALSKEGVAVGGVHDGRRGGGEKGQSQGHRGQRVINRGTVCTHSTTGALVEAGVAVEAAGVEPER